MARIRKAWLRELLKKRARIEEAVGARLIGEPLGCGHYGCVFASDGPWVVKLTVDANEGPMVKKLAEFAEENDYVAPGFVRVKSITRLLPDVGTGKRKRPVYAIVREDVAPLLSSDDAGFSRETMRRVPGLPSDSWYNVVDSPAPQRGAAAELKATLRGLREYQDAGYAVKATRSRRGVNALRNMPRSAIEAAVYNATRRMTGAIGSYLGEFLSELYSHTSIVLEDVHLGNVGWRVHRDIEPWGDFHDGLVVFDPGHTPISKRSTGIEEMYVENGWGMAHAAWLLPDGQVVRLTDHNHHDTVVNLLWDQEKAIARLRETGRTGLLSDVRMYYEADNPSSVFWLVQLPADVHAVALGSSELDASWMVKDLQAHALEELGWIRTTGKHFEVNKLTREKLERIVNHILEHIGTAPGVDITIAEYGRYAVVPARELVMMRRPDEVFGHAYR